MNVNGYLKRLDVKEQRQASLDFLRLLQNGHVTRIPFENLDIVGGIPLSLNAEDQYDKIVARERGGVCYELNGLFHELLRELGFSVSLTAATVKTEDGWFVTGSHAINMVRVDGSDYLVDVGFGGRTPRQPVPITGEEVHDADGGSYRIRPWGGQEGKLVLERREGSVWDTLYKFDPAETKRLKDFYDVFMMTQCGEQSKFNKMPVAMILTEEGRITLNDHSLTMVMENRKAKEVIKPGDFEKVLADIFNIKSSPIQIER
ncbi:arylamine N-acetyltransferase [Paenibacillus sp. VCA1]|uniref:arylamine N-acetyltransferase family protein n=1 Tax=Paenibacillus sp. VCA1 TaxID=3039148 RepID=UPI0028712FCE|nr:arylamine N-acetyltransferase [Paenibacillus sp. VCA1]MDR9852069.1 arylamine N-acetyltransferase [Paenibacillus sp. VCA1]